MKDFRTVSFESLFNADLDYESFEIIKNKLIPIFFAICLIKECMLKTH